MEMTLNSSFLTIENYDLENIDGGFIVIGLAIALGAGALATAIATPIIYNDLKNCYRRLLS